MNITLNLICGFVLLAFNIAIIIWLMDIWYIAASIMAIFIFIFTVPYMLIFFMTKDEPFLTGFRDDRTLGRLDW